MGAVRGGSRRASAAGATSGGRATDTASPRARSGRSDAARGSGGAAATAAGRASFWTTQETGRRYDTDGDRSLGRRLAAVALSVGPWLAVHAVLLALTFWTAEHAYVWLVENGAAPLLALCVAAGEVGLAVALIGLHLLVSFAR